MGWCFEDQANSYTEKILDKLQESVAWVPSPLWEYELANVLLVAERRKKLTRQKSERFLELLQSLSIIPTPLDKKAHLLLAFGRKFQLSSYDTMYILLAQDKKLPLATRDKALQKACRQAGVTWLNP